jgi:serine/threonine-protein kinase
MNLDTKLPDQIGRYPVERLLGRGAMGSVYLARDMELDRDVAIKTVRMPNLAEDAESFLVRFRNEARAVGRLRHRSIVAVYDVGNDRAVGPYLVFEYVEGATLKEILRERGAMAPEQVIALAEQVGGALDAAHREGIIHRDIKPDNLLVGTDGVVRLADFGVARVPDAALTGEGQFLGTPCYGAPETLRGGASGPLSDQFSFAAVLYEAVSGVRAFPGTDAVAVAHSVIHDEPPPPSAVAAPGTYVPPALDRVILRGLRKVPEQRYEHLSALVADVRRAYGLTTASGASAADTLPVLPGMMPRPSQPPVNEKRTVPLWPFAVALAVGVLAVVQLAPSAPARVDANGQVPAQAPSDRQLTQHMSPTPRVPNAQDVVANDGGGTQALKDAAPQALENPAQLSAFEREERAKDALDRAQRAFDAGDKDRAREALDEAFRYDPEHPDIAALRRKL